MKDALGAVGIAVLGAFLSLILKESGFHGARVFSALVIVGSALFSIKGIADLMRSVYSLPITDEIEGGVGYVMRIVGTSYLFGISSDVCREIGEGGIASAVLAVGRVEILLLSLPAISEIFKLAGELL